MKISQIYKQIALSPLSDEHNQYSQKFPASVKISTSLLIEIRSIENALKQVLICIYSKQAEQHLIHM